MVITGQGKIFSAGVDLLRATTSGPDYFKSFLPALAKLYTQRRSSFRSPWSRR